MYVANIDHPCYGAVAIVAGRQAWQLHTEKTLQSLLSSILCTNNPDGISARMLKETATSISAIYDHHNLY